MTSDEIEIKYTVDKYFNSIKLIVLQNHKNYYFNSIIFCMEYFRTSRLFNSKL